MRTNGHNFSILSRIYLGISIFSGIAVMTGVHRPMHRILSALFSSDFIVGSLSGILNLSWHEYAYIIGKPLRSTVIFEYLPIAYGILAILSAFALGLHLKSQKLLLRGTLILGFFVAAVSVIILILKQEADTWRISTCLALMAANVGWWLHFNTKFRR